MIVNIVPRKACTSHYLIDGTHVRSVEDARGLTIGGKEHIVDASVLFVKVNGEVGLEPWEVLAGNNNLERKIVVVLLGVLLSRVLLVKLGSV